MIRRRQCSKEEQVDNQDDSLVGFFSEKQQQAQNEEEEEKQRGMMNKHLPDMLNDRHSNRRRVVLGKKRADELALQFNYFIGVLIWIVFTLLSYYIDNPTTTTTTSGETPELSSMPPQEHEVTN